MCEHLFFCVYGFYLGKRGGAFFCLVGLGGGGLGFWVLVGWLGGWDFL